MKDLVDANKLQEAVINTLKYHPTFQTRLIKKGQKQNADKPFNNRHKNVQVCAPVFRYSGR